MLVKSTFLTLSFLLVASSNSYASCNAYNSSGQCTSYSVRNTNGTTSNVTTSRNTSSAPVQPSYSLTQQAINAAIASEQMLRQSPAGGSYCGSYCADDARMAVERANKIAALTGKPAPTNLQQVTNMNATVGWTVGVGTARLLGQINQRATVVSPVTRR